MHRDYARAPRGEAVYGAVSGRKFKRAGIVSAQCEGKIIAPLQYEGTMNGTLFVYWFEHILLAEVSAGAVIVMDNATFHRKKVLHHIAEKADCFLIFLPPYSPDLNPIEHFWAWFKRKLRELLLSYGNFDDAFTACFQFD